MKHVLTIPQYLPPSLGRMLSAHWTTKYKLKEECAELISYYASKQEIPKSEGGKRRVSIALTLSGRSKAMDPDNCYKAILDALKRARLIYDDGPNHCELGLVTQEKGKERTTVITLEDL